jgi:hypothetical protein
VSWLLKMVTFPVSGPILGTVWIAEQLRLAAEREMAQDEARTRQELVELGDQFSRGLIGADEYEEASEVLLTRLISAWDERQETR